MTDDNRTKIFCFINDSQQGKFHAVALVENGIEAASCVEQDIAACKDRLQHDPKFLESYRILGGNPGYRLLWVDEPQSHPELVRAAKIHATNTEPPKATIEHAQTPGEVKAIYEEHAICIRCRNGAVCEVGRSIRRFADSGMFVIVGGCTEHEDPEES